MRKESRRRLIRDAALVIVSIVIAVYIARSGAIDAFLGIFGPYVILASFVAGLFFTSIFTTSPAIVVLGKLSLIGDPLSVAAAGALGAMVGDLVIFQFVKNHLAEDVATLVSAKTRLQVRHIFEYRFFRWSIAILGALIISSPLPDELGLAMMGMSKVSTKVFLPVSFVMNAVGILAIGAFARQIAGI